MPLLAPTGDDLSRIDEQWKVAGGLVREHVGQGLDRSPCDIERLQTLIERGVLTGAHTYELQCLGIALGQVLARNVAGLDWAVIEDEYGRDPTIRYRDTSFQVNVLTLISKRVEAGQPVDVQGMYEWVRAQLKTLGSEVD
jgi:uncharacterized protein DUF3806